jgi:copper chaperone CopZ
VCAHAVRVAVKSVNGVDSVDVSLSKGMATISLRPGNTVQLKQLLAAITKNGFTTKQSKVIANGTVLADAGGLRLKISGSNESLALKGDAPLLDKAKGLIGKTVTATGTIGEVQKGKTAEEIQLNAIELAKEQ